MAFCQKCGNPLAEGDAFCKVCGTPVAEQPQAPVQPPMPQYQAPQYPPMSQYAQMMYDPADHTADFDAEDISANKVIAMSAYMLSVVGILIALLAAPESKYAGFHARQALKLEIVNVLVGLITAILCWTIIVPILGGIAIIVLMVVRIILFLQVCKGQAKDAPIISKLNFLK